MLNTIEIVAHIALVWFTYGFFTSSFKKAELVSRKNNNIELALSVFFVIFSCALLFLASFLLGQNVHDVVAG